MACVNPGIRWALERTRCTPTWDGLAPAFQPPVVAGVGKPKTKGNHSALLRCFRVNAAPRPHTPAFVPSCVQLGLGPAAGRSACNADRRQARERSKCLSTAGFPTTDCLTFAGCFVQAPHTLESLGSATNAKSGAHIWLVHAREKSPLQTSQRGSRCA